MINEGPSTVSHRKADEFIMGDYLASVIQKFKKAMNHWRFMVLLGLIFSAGAGIYAIVIPTRYVAKVNFVIEESKQNAGGLFSALAGQIGMDLSAVSGSTGLLAGDNVLQLLKSPTLLKKVLLSPHPTDSARSLAWYYAQQYGLFDKIRPSSTKKSELFPIHSMAGQLGRQQDSLLSLLTKQIIEDELAVFKPDRKLSIFSLELSTRNELLSQLIAMRLIHEAADLYIDTKTRRLRINADRLQSKSDSIAKLLNRQTYSTTAANLFNANTGMSTTFANLDITAREKSMLGVLYADLNKSLEITRTALIQETPTIEIIDRPIFPLLIKSIKWYRAILAGFFSGVLFFYFLYFVNLYPRRRI